ncbi:MAG: hypothetical protein ABIH09_05270 [Candidatus Omnitrophota bacterium]
MPAPYDGKEDIFTEQVWASRGASGKRVMQVGLKSYERIKIY